MGNYLSIDAAYDEAYFSLKEFGETENYLEKLKEA